MSTLSLKKNCLAALLDGAAAAQREREREEEDGPAHPANLRSEMNDCP